MDSNKIYLDNKLTIGIVDHSSRNYITKCIYESKVPEKRPLLSFKYYIICYDESNNLIEYRFKLLENKDNEVTYDLSINNNLVNSIKIYIDTKQINKDTDYMIYFIQNNDIFIAHNIYLYMNDDIQFKDICTIYRENNNWYTLRSIPILDNTTDNDNTTTTSDI